jgi:hypothetical protein
MSWAKELGIEKIFNNADEIFGGLRIMCKSRIRITLLQEKARALN